MIWVWRNKLLKEPSKLGDRGTHEIDTMIKWIEEHIPKDLEKPTDKLHNHNILDIEEYRLDKWQEKTKNTIQWKDKGVILQKLYEGAGKTKSLKQLRFPSVTPSSDHGLAHCLLPGLYILSAYRCTKGP